MALIDQPLIVAAVLIVPVFIVGWLRQLKTQNAGTVDVIWSFGVSLAAVYYTVAGTGDIALRITVGVIYALWFGRLGIHLLRRVAAEKEDGRYAAMRDWAGPRANKIFLFFYLMQAGWVWLFALPAWFLSRQEAPSAPFVVAAVVLAICAWLGESVADRQLAEFKSKPENRGKTCREGLWRYSRHPNYFFEWLHWFVYPLLGMHAAGGLWLWLSPVVMFLFLYFVTGIPFTEKQALRSRGEEYRRYQRTTSMFIPWRPKC